MKKGNNLIHVEFKDGFLNPTIDNKEGKHFYFGTLTAIYEHFNSEQIGAARQTIYQLWDDKTRLFETKACFIRKGSLIRKPANRKQPIRLLRVQ